MSQLPISNQSPRPIYNSRAMIGWREICYLSGYAAVQVTYFEGSAIVFTEAVVSPPVLHRLYGSDQLTPCWTWGDKYTARHPLFTHIDFTEPASSGAGLYSCVGIG